MRLIIFILFISCLSSCSRAYDYTCENTSINPVFINFMPSDLDTFVLRKFAANTNFTNKLDSAVIVFGLSGYYTTSYDTTLVRLNSEKISIGYGFDYELYISGENRIIKISEITSETRTETCHPVAKVACACYNRFFSLKKDNQILAFGNTGNYYIYIDK